MSITINGNNGSGEDIWKFVSDNTASGDKNSKTKSGQVKSIYAGNIFGPTDKNDRLEEKKNFARKKAMKIVKDAWEADESKDNAPGSLRQQRQDALASIRSLNKDSVEIDRQKKEVEDKYGIDKDSQEQKDLELLEKFQDRQNGVKGLEFTEEEVDRLRELQDIQRTDYQKDILRLNASSGEIQSKIQDAGMEADMLIKAAADSEVEMLKTDNMADANRAVDAIMKLTNDEILSSLIKDGKDNVDDDMEKEKEKQAEKEEKKQQEEEIEQAREEQKSEKEQQIEENRRESSEQRQMLQGVTTADKIENEVKLKQKPDNSLDYVPMNIKKVLSDNALIEEDLKGIKIDFNF